MVEVSELLVAWRKSVAELDRSGLHFRGRSDVPARSNDCPELQQQVQRRLPERMSAGPPLAHAPP